MWKDLRGRMKTGLSFPVHSSFDYSFHENSGASKYLDIFVYIKMTMVIPVPNLFGIAIVRYGILSNEQEQYGMRTVYFEIIDNY